MLDKRVSEAPVVVTGASGYIGLHIVKLLLARGYSVRGTLRDMLRADDLRSALARAGVECGNLEFCEADLTQETRWSAVMQGVEYVMHVASPLPRIAPRREDELIVPAREGTLLVLAAARDARVKRVVMTSSMAAVMCGRRRDGSRAFNEEDWSDPKGRMGAYERSKTLAERAAWAFVDALPEDERIELVTLNLGVVLGPILERDYGTSVEIVRKLMRRDLPGLPRLNLTLVDVRDVAELHVAAMERPEAAGKRFCAGSESVPYRRIAQILERHFGPRGYRVPRRYLPDWVVRLAAVFDRTTALVVPELGNATNVDCTRAREILGWKPRPLEETVVATGESLIAHGVL